MPEFVHFCVASHVEQPARGVVGSGTERLVVGEEGNGIDVGLVSEVGLDALAGSDVPNLGGGISSFLKQFEQSIRSAGSHCANGNSKLPQNSCCES
jgi:hypothetical protein